MDFNLISTAYAQAKPAAKSAAPIWPMFVALIAVFYFFIIRPQQKKQKDTEKMLNEVLKGDRVITIGGIYGTVLNIKEKKTEDAGEDIVVLKVSDNMKIEMIRSSIAKVIKKTGEDTKE